MKTFFVFFVSFFTVSFAYDVSNFVGTESTLKLVHVIFRHGDRTPDSLYPKDPYTEDDFYPFRIAHLTNKGKLRAYNIGTYLRKKYNKLLGDVYTPDILYGISSHYPRCRASLESVLAGLYPPSEELIWNKELLWEPIPYDYLPMKENNLFLPVYTCPNMNTLVTDIYQNLDSDPIIQKYNYLLPFLVENTGLTGNLYSIAINLWSTLKSEEEAGLKIPIWAQTVYPEILSEITKYSWEVYSRTPDLKTLSSGFLMSKIINNTFSTLNGENEARNRKIYLYSGHDFNVGAVLSYLDNFVPHLINYGAHVIIEVHKYIGIYFLKFLHENNDDLEPQPLFIPNCGIYCPLDAFVRLYSKALDPAILNTLCTG
ncbi:venom acid phosphatase Acph-1-like [Onthophagus taurus]|uniref:venom acid phosphatase Acph-1-like n=1 Tax=Onthophagus taurus TaxID=166361 RepID=UPI0039BE6728